MARRKFSRGTNQRKALFRGLANSLILYEKIVTTEPKAKAIRPIVEKLITKAKVGGIHERRQVEALLGNPNSTKKMFDLVGPKFKTRAGGYLRITKMGPRAGDAANLAKIEFVEEISILPPKVEAIVEGVAKKEVKASKEVKKKTSGTRKVEKKDGKERKTDKK